MAESPAAPPSPSRPLSRFDKDHPHYRWVALSNTTLGMLMATINSSIVIISLPAIFRGIHLDPLEPGNVGYLLWIIMGFLVVSAVLVVTLGRLGDIYGRVKMYNLGFAVFSVFSVLLSVDPFTGGPGAMWLIVMRIGQGIGGAMLFANATAILTDAFPADQRGMALGINQVSAIAGSFLGLLIGGLLSEWHWRAVFWVSVPIGVLGDRLGLPVPRRAGRPPPQCPARRTRQPHLRGRPDRAAGRDHLRHPALRRPQHRLDEPVGARRPDRRHDAAGRLHLRRAASRAPDGLDRPVPDPLRSAWPTWPA